MKRDFITEIKECQFKPLLYTLYMMLDDKGYLLTLESLHKTKYTIEDFEYYNFTFNNREKIVMKVRNKEYLNDIQELLNITDTNKGIFSFIDYDKGSFFIIKLKEQSIF